ncbi:squalene/phytoene synthase family protein [Kitasatospora sp. GP82]|uniref:squalene/phytoene synthase family protein n=1 Tax=Kitasatospora sp. GP82 TaxID=3035089 RepID=UPI002476DD4F|nr:squalene/phytoene synthase family protein [Kitasatospora sp. GP82]MDH6124345.1 phytoene synthase [Kitasatospora sp. GP82]
MPTWRRTLTAAGITEAPVRAVYTAAARRVLRREQAPYLALRLLAEPALVPYLAAGLAFMNLVDDVAESGSVEQRTAGLRRLGERTAEALSSGHSADPVLAAYAHAVAARALPLSWVSSFLEGAAAVEASFAGFETDRDYQAYLDDYACPGLLVFAGLQYEGGPDARAAAGWRRFVDAAQRVDFLADLAGDLGDGRLCIPREQLDRYGVTRRQLEQGADTEAVRALLAELCGQARAALEGSRDVIGLSAPGLRPVVQVMAELMECQLRAVERAGAGALRRDVGYGVVAPLRVLARARRDAGRSLRAG